MSTEIERKFIVENIPFDIESFPKADIAQGYIDPNGSTEVRVRTSIAYDYVATTSSRKEIIINGHARRSTIAVKDLQKEGSHLVRLEDELEIDKKIFDILWIKARKYSLHKTRYFIETEQNTIELDIYLGNWKGLQIAEVEFETVEDANEFSPPEWFGKEVTDDYRFKNAYLASFSSEGMDTNDLLKYMQRDR